MTVAVEPLSVLIENPVQSGEYNTTWDAWGEAHFRVTLQGGAGGDVPLVLGEDYTVAPSGRATGHTFTLLADPEDATGMLIERDTIVAQEATFPPTAAGFEAALDRLTMSVQERIGEYLNSVLAPLGVQGLRLPALSAGVLSPNDTLTELIWRDLDAGLIPAGLVMTAYPSPAQAVAAALAAGEMLYWGPGTHVAANMPNFHEVRHFGPGIIDADGTLFRVEPRASEEQNLFVATDGSDANDGLSAERPLRTIDRAYDILQDYWRKASDAGLWAITLGDGAFAEINQVDEFRSFGGLVTIRGATRPWIAHAAGQTVVVGDYRTGFSSKMLYRAETDGVTGANSPTATFGTASDGAVTWRHVGGFRDWAASETITQDVSMRVSGGKVYLARSGGTCGVVAPTHTSSVATDDGGIVWQYVGVEMPIPPAEPTTIIDGSLNPKAWVSGETGIRLGDTRSNASKAYQAMTAGTAGATPPTHTSGTASDGTITWKYLGAVNLLANGLAFWFEPDANVSIENIKFKNWSKTGFNDYGALAKNSRDFRVIDCVFDNCELASAIIGGGGYSRFYGNIYFNCSRAAWATYPSTHTIGSAAQPCFVVGSEIGAFISRGTMGHVDYCEFASCDNAASVGLNARSNVMGCRFRGGSGAPLSTLGGGLVESGVPNHYFWGVPNMSVSRPGVYARSSFGEVLDTRIRQVFISDQTRTTFTADGGTAGVLTQVATAADTKTQFPEWTLAAIHKPLLVDFWGVLAGTAGIKTLSIRASANDLVSFASINAASTGAFRLQMIATPRANTPNPDISVVATLLINGDAARVVHFDRSFDTVSAYGEWLAINCRFYATLAASGDSVSTRLFEVSVEG